jgi:general secretion pathway protein G
MRKQGFTLIELIVVIAIIAILAAVIAPRAFQSIEKAKVAKAVTDYKAIKAGCMSLYGDTGNLPHGYNSQVPAYTSDLMVNASGWRNWDGPYMNGFKGMHPWGGTYYFTTNYNLNPADGSAFELSIELENRCFGNNTNSGCPMPDPSGDRIDLALDDGNRTSGNVQKTSWGDWHWALYWDICPTSSCW